MSILVCGGAGYIGSHVNKLLYQKGYDTIIFDNLVYGHKEAVKWGKFIQGDLGNTEELGRVFKDNKIEAVFHFAGYAYVGESVSQPDKYYVNNVCNTINLLNVMRKYGCDKIIFSSTCATFGIPKEIPITEDMEQKPINPYGASKLMVERILQDYDHAYGMHYAVLRYFNAAGADPEGEIGESHQPETHLIPIVLEVAGGKKDAVEVFGTDYDTPDGSCIRDYIHVSDLADAHLAALHYLEKGSKSDCFNLGNEKGTSVLEVIRMAEAVTGKDIRVQYAERRQGDPPKLVGCSKKAVRILGWEPKYSDIEQIIRHAWNWYCSKKY